MSNDFISPIEIYHRIREDEEVGKMNSDKSYLPRQYRFGLAGYDQDDIIEKYIKFHASGTILNIGCGNNYTQNANLAKISHHFIAGDISKNNIRILKDSNREQNLEPRVLDAKKLDLDECSINLILAIGLYAHFRDNKISDFPEQSFKEFYRVNMIHGHLLVCNNEIEPIDPYIKIGQDIGYTLLERNFARDIKKITGSSCRYLLCFQKSGGEKI